MGAGCALRVEQSCESRAGRFLGEVAVDLFKTIMRFAKSQYVARFAKSRHVQHALAVHRDLVILLGQEAERQGLTEEELMAELEEVKWQVYRETYGE
jgi:hypothetical protein